MAEQTAGHRCGICHQWIPLYVTHWCAGAPPQTGGFQVGVDVAQARASHEQQLKASRCDQAEARAERAEKEKLHAYQRGYRAGHTEGLHEPDPRREQALHAAREVLAAEGEPEGLMLEALQVIDKALEGRHG